MVKSSRARRAKPERLDATFAALSDGTRRSILARLSEEEATVSELAKPFSMSLPAISKHLTVLEDAGLVTRERDGRLRRCRLVPQPMHDAIAWIVRYGRFWEGRFDELDRYLRDTAGKEGGR